MGVRRHVGLEVLVRVRCRKEVVAEPARGKVELGRERLERVVTERRLLLQRLVLENGRWDEVSGKERREGVAVGRRRGRRANAVRRLRHLGRLLPVLSLLLLLLLLVLVLLVRRLVG